MKRWWLLAAAVIMVGGLFFMSRGRGPKMSACKVLVAACEKAGIKRGTSPQGRREFHHNCLMPIFTTGGLLGESFDPDLVSNCKAIFQKRRSRSKDES